jgi:hypothetical protein
MISPDVQILELKRQAKRANEAASLELSPALQKKEREALKALAEVNAAKAQIAADRRNARAARIRSCKETLANLRSTWEPIIEAAVRAGDPDALAAATADAAAAVRSVSPEIEAVREVMTDAEANSFVQVGPHESWSVFGTVRGLVAVLKGALDLNEDSAIKLAKNSDLSVIGACIRKIADEPTLANGALLLTLIGEVKRFASVGNGHWYGWKSWPNGRSDNQARFWRGLDLLLQQGGYKGADEITILTLLRHESLGLDI